MGNGDAHQRLQRPLTQKRLLLGPWLVWLVQIAAQLCMFVVPRAGIEPARRFNRRRILSPMCLPISPPGHCCKPASITDLPAMLQTAHI